VMCVCVYIYRPIPAYILGGGGITHRPFVVVRHVLIT
jgi:hypothetical protein